MGSHLVYWEVVYRPLGLMGYGLCIGNVRARKYPYWLNGSSDSIMKMSCNVSSLGGKGK